MAWLDRRKLCRFQDIVAQLLKATSMHQKIVERKVSRDKSGGKEGVTSCTCASLTQLLIYPPQADHQRFSRFGFGLSQISSSFAGILLLRGLHKLSFPFNSAKEPCTRSGDVRRTPTDNIVHETRIALQVVGIDSYGTE
jgi:hypothetical protein